jgi:SAM-dependent methyltransferase
MNRPSQYDGFAADYHWLYSDYVLSGKAYLAEHDDVLREAGPAARILDCSCGIGTFPLGLAKLGYAVSGSDRSSGMIDQANLAAAHAGLTVPFTRCAWQYLPSHFSDPFDLIFCLGNSIGHASSGEEMLQSLQGMRAVLKRGGKLVMQSRNWERLREQRKGFTLYQWRERNGQRCLPIYVWNYPDRFEDTHTIDVLLVFDSGDKASIRSYPINYHPFRIEELTDRLRSAGFPNIQINFTENREDYLLIAS